MRSAGFPLSLTALSTLLCCLSACGRNDSETTRRTEPATTAAPKSGTTTTSAQQVAALKVSLDEFERIERDLAAELQDLKRRLKIAALSMEREKVTAPTPEMTTMALRIASREDHLKAARAQATKFRGLLAEAEQRRDDEALRERIGSAETAADMVRRDIHRVAVEQDMDPTAALVAQSKADAVIRQAVQSATLLDTSTLPEGPSMGALTATVNDLIAKGQKATTSGDFLRAKDAYAEALLYLSRVPGAGVEDFRTTVESLRAQAEDQERWAEKAKVAREVQVLAEQVLELRRAEPTDWARVVAICARIIQEHEPRDPFAMSCLDVVISKSEVDVAVKAKAKEAAQWFGKPVGTAARLVTLLKSASDALERGDAEVADRVLAEARALGEDPQVGPMADQVRQLRRESEAALAAKAREHEMEAARIREEQETRERAAAEARRREAEAGLLASLRASLDRTPPDASQAIGFAKALVDIGPEAATRAVGEILVRVEGSMRGRTTTVARWITLRPVVAFALDVQEQSGVAADANETRLLSILTSLPGEVGVEERVSFGERVTTQYGHSRSKVAAIWIDGAAQALRRSPMGLSSAQRLIERARALDPASAERASAVLLGELSARTANLQAISEADFFGLADLCQALIAREEALASPAMRFAEALRAYLRGSFEGSVPSMERLVRESPATAEGRAAAVFLTPPASGVYDVSQMSPTRSGGLTLQPRAIRVASGLITVELFCKLDARSDYGHNSLNWQVDEVSIIDDFGVRHPSRLGWQGRGVYNAFHSATNFSVNVDKVGVLLSAQFPMISRGGTGFRLVMPGQGMGSSDWMLDGTFRLKRAPFAAR